MTESEKELAKRIRTAIKQGNTEEVVSLLRAHPSQINFVTPFGTWLHVAASYGNLDLAKFLVASGADVNQRAGIIGGAPVNEAASEGHIDIVDFLLSHGVELDVSDPRRNPLFAAIYGGHLDIIKLLIAKGIDPRVKYTSKTMKNMDALAFALERGQIEIATFLKSHPIGIR